MKTPTLEGSLRYASGEELLMLAVFGAARLKQPIDRELDRRAIRRRFAVRTPRTVTKRAA